MRESNLWFNCIGYQLFVFVLMKTVNKTVNEMLKIDLYETKKPSEDG